MRYSNLHTHTTFSDGIHTPEENVQSAIQKGMLSLGFSDHSYTACDPSYCMLPERYEPYRRTVRELQQRYQGEIPIYLGMELDYYSQRDCDDYDYLLTSVHYIVHKGVCYPIDHSPQQQRDCIREVFGGDVLAMAQAYFDMVCEHVERNKPTAVGHFDVITKFSLMPEEDPQYRQIAREALKRVLKTCPYIEVNTGAISRGWRKSPYPSRDLLQTILENGGEVLLSSDSHNKANLDFWFPEAEQILRQEGFRHICVFTGEGFQRIPL